MIHPLHELSETAESQGLCKERNREAAVVKTVSGQTSAGPSNAVKIELMSETKGNRNDSVLTHRHPE